jgi:signal transduction histidine kinase/PAS domain-containing protein
MAARCRTLDWSATPLGPIEGWSQSLRTTVGTVLSSRNPMILFWGPEHVQLYNDAYRPSLGEGGHHPRALGMRAREVWPEIWHVIGSQIETVMAKGAATWHEDQHIPLVRNGKLEDAWWTYSYSPVRDDDGSVAGALVVLQETTARVLAERRMRELNDALEVERTRLADVFRQAPSFIAVLRAPTHVFELANDPYYQLVGHRDLVGKSVFDALPEVRDQGFIELLDGVVATGIPFVGREMPILLARTPGASPEQRYLDFVYQPLVDVDGTRSGVLAHGTDVTEQVVARREVERLLAESEQGRQTLAAVNARLQEQQMELELANERLQENAAELEMQTEELQSTASRLEARTQEAERAHEEAETARQQLAFLADASERLASSLDYETTLKHIVSLAVPTLADWAAYNVAGDDGTVKTVAIHHPDPAKEELAREIGRRFPLRADDSVGVAKVIRTGEPELISEIPDEVLEVVAHDPEHLRMLKSIGFRSLINVPLVAGGRVLGALGFGTGESGRHFDEDDLAFALELARRAAVAIDNAGLYREAQAARADAEAANKTKSQFLSTMSHELRTPLNAIAGYAQLLAMGVRGPVTEAQLEDLERVQRASQHLQSLINDILNFARLEAGQVRYDVQDVSLDAVVRDLEALLLPELRERGIAYDHGGCVVDGGTASAAVRADPEKLRQILLNLLTNALKFTAEGGRVWLRCDLANPARDGTGIVRLRVTDTGRGIPEEELTRIFEPFVQVDRHLTTGSQQGVGLGLAISRDLARGMGGDLMAESEVGVGSTFTLTLPQARS